jgi:hypothetical protein
MDVGRVSLTQAVPLDFEPKLDRRRLVQGALAVSLTLAGGRSRELEMVRDASLKKYSDALLGTAALTDPSRDLAAGAHLEAALHVMMQ